MGLANLSVKILKKDNFVCIQDSTNYQVELVIETAYFFRAVGHSWSISSDQDTISTVD